MKNQANLPITAEQSRAARFQLGLTQANVIEQSELPSHKLKQFETGRFIPDTAFLQSLKEFYEDSGYAFAEAETKATSTVAPKATHGSSLVEPMFTMRFVVDRTLQQEQADSILERMDNNDVRIAELMNLSLESGLLSAYSGKTDSETKELFGLMAENYLLFRILQGRNILVPVPEEAEPETQADLVSGLFSAVAMLNQQPSGKTTQAEVIE